jgi:hypothetical protein
VASLLLFDLGIAAPADAAVFVAGRVGLSYGDDRCTGDDRPKAVLGSLLLLRGARRRGDPGHHVRADALGPEAGLAP